MKLLKDIHHWLLDMDGVLYHGSRPLPGAAEFIVALQGEEIPFLLVTNNSTLTPEEYVDKVGRMGMQVTPEDVLTSSIATAEYLSKIAPPGAPVHMIGENGVRTALLDKGFEVVDRGGDYVVVGMDRGLTFDILSRATLAIRAGATFIGTNPDMTLPVEEGQIPGNGAVLAALQAATGIAPLIIGKPEAALLEIGMERLGVTRAGTAILGDRVETDILGGERAGLITVMVLSGASTRKDLDETGLEPDLLFQNVVDLVEAWQVR